MHIAILNGAFNPPHWGHLTVAEQVLDFCPVDNVWLMPTYFYNPRFNKKLAPFAHRTAMARFLERPKIKVSDLEKNVKGPSYTYKVIKYLQKKYPTITFSFIIGSDNLTTFSKWYRWQDLLKICKIFVFPREKIDQKTLYKNMVPVVSPLLKTTPVSSTLIRKTINQKKSLEGLIPPEVINYIAKNRLY